jgi:hypothetical protein
MTELLRRALRRLDDFTTATFKSAAPLSRHYRAAARLSQRG